MERSINEFMELIIKNNLFYNWHKMNRVTRLIFRTCILNYLEFLFTNINYQNKSVLDIGGGSGFISFFLAFMGAKDVICLEPEFQGSDNDVCNAFRKASNIFSLNNVGLHSCSLQRYDSKNKTFDLIILHNSINHLDEDACIHLQSDMYSRSKYINILSKLKELSAFRAQILITDCSCNNFFSKLPIKNPFIKEIEWQKHQTPYVWINLLTEIGFNNPTVRWTPIPIFGSSLPVRLGRWITSRQSISYFLMSHFTLTCISD